VVKSSCLHLTPSVNGILANPQPHFLISTPLSSALNLAIFKYRLAYRALTLQFACFGLHFPSEYKIQTCLIILSQNEQQGCASADHIKNTLYSDVVLPCNSLDSAYTFCWNETYKLMAEYQLHDLHDNWVLNINRRPIWKVLYKFL